MLTSVPNLRLDSLSVHRDTPRRELDADRALALKVEFVPCESGEKVRLSCTRVANEDDFEKVVVVGFGGHLVCVCMCSEIGSNLLG